MNTTHRPYAHVRSLKAKLAAREHDLGGMVGKSFTFHSLIEGDEPPRRLYPDRDGMRCTVTGMSDDIVPCPLIVAFEDGFRGISEPRWLERRSHVG